MSSDQYRRTLSQKQRDLAAQQSKKAGEVAKLASLSRDAQRAREGMARSTSPSTRTSRGRDLERILRQSSDVERNIAAIEKKMSDIQGAILTAERYLQQEVAKEDKKKDEERRRAERAHARRMADLATTVQAHSALHQETQATIAALSRPKPRITVLFLAANPVDQEQLRLDVEAREIHNKIRLSAHRDSVVFKTTWALRSQDLLQALNEHQPTVVHFSGHGTDTEEIVFESPSGEAKYVSKEAIVQVMKTVADDIRLVFFNTCFSEAQAEAVVEHIDAAIGMGTSIGDEAARVFASNFYSAIGFGHSIRKAFDQGVAALMLEDIPEHDTPQLFVRDGVDAGLLYLVETSQSGP